MTTYHATLYAPDGARVTDFHNRESIEQVWSMVADMGSRWIFYPLVVVTGDDGIIVAGYRNGTVDTEQLVGMTEKEAGQFIKERCEIVSVASYHDEISL